MNAKSARTSILVTGCSGRIGSEAVSYFDKLGCAIAGIDNNMRMDFFGPEGDTRWNLQRLIASTSHFTHYGLDIRDRAAIFSLFDNQSFDLIIHCAAQPSHDLAARRPLDDFDVNALGTVNLLEATRRSAPEAVFILLSTNKVYGDAPNELPLVELETRYDYAREDDWRGIDESCRIDQTLHSLFGASKVAADVITQEYGRYFGMRTAVLRGGCLTGPNHSGVELHGFLSYLVKVAMKGDVYTIQGYKGKQVRDNIHSHDVLRAIHAIFEDPDCGAVYNLGGGRNNSVSILEAFDRVGAMIGKKANFEFVDQARRGDHMCYISDLTRFRARYPHWDITISLDDILEEIVNIWSERFRAEAAKV